MGKSLLLLLADMAAAVLLTIGLLAYQYLTPKDEIPAVPFPDVTASAEMPKNRRMVNGLAQTNIKLDTADWHEKFAGQFTDTVVAGDTSYTSPDVSIHLTYGSYDSGILDEGGDENQAVYGTAVSYVLADIYLGDITCLQTAFAQDRYGVGNLELLTDMSKRTGSVLAVNGDSYNSNQQDHNGTIIRNGTIYRNNPSEAETCVLNWDGTMKIYGPGEINTRQLVEEGAYQSWVFGPSLLDENGIAKTEFVADGYLYRSHPRTAIGYYEPGHYCLIAVNGRQAESRGMFLDEMASLFESLGCKAAYNLDGGHSNCMTMYGSVVNHLYDREFEIPDGIFIMEGNR